MDEEGILEINLIFNIQLVGCMSLSAADDILGCCFRKWLLWSVIQRKKKLFFFLLLFACSFPSWFLAFFNSLSPQL